MKPIAFAFLLLLLSPGAAFTEEALRNPDQRMSFSFAYSGATGQTQFYDQFGRGLYRYDFTGSRIRMGLTVPTLHWLSFHAGHEIFDDDGPDRDIDDAYFKRSLKLYEIGFKIYLP